MITVAGVAVGGGRGGAGCDVDGRSSDDGLGDVGAEGQGVTVGLGRWMGETVARGGRCTIKPRHAFSTGEFFEIEFKELTGRPRAGHDVAVWGGGTGGGDGDEVEGAGEVRGEGAELSVGG